MQKPILKTKGQSFVLSIITICVLLCTAHIIQAFNKEIVKYPAKSTISNAKAPLQVGVYFVGGTTQSLTVQEDAGAASINSYVAVHDASSGRTLTWTVQTNALHGTIVTGGTQTSIVGNITPTGFTYQPTAGYAGTDAFTIHISDGVTSNNTTINVTIKLPTHYYVTPGGGGSKDGSSWLNAMDSIAFRTNISTIAYGDTVWIAAGTYHPSITDPTVSFNIPSGVAVYGGFNGTETALSQRNVTANTTILDGTGPKKATSVNTYNIVVFTNVSNTTILDGFTIQNGISNGTNNDANSGGVSVGNYPGGAGVYNNGIGGASSPQLANDIFINNTAPNGYAGAVYDDASFSGNNAATYTNCAFTNNTADYVSAVYVSAEMYGQTKPTFTNCTFTGNSCPAVGSGALWNDGSNYGICNPTITNCIFTSNICHGGGGQSGAMYNMGVEGSCNAKVTNCLFSGNQADYGGAVVNDGTNRGSSASSFTNCTFVNNLGTTYVDAVLNWNGNGGNDKPTFTNCIFRDNGNEIDDEYGSVSTVTYSDVQGGWTGAGSNNISSDPLFVSSSNFNLQASSPCINTGSVSAIPTGITTDLAGNVRTQNNTVDMGAYESPYTPVITHYYVTPGGAGTKNGASWANAMDSIALRTNLPTTAYGDTFWIAKGVYHPNLSNDTNKFVIPSGVKVYGGFAGTETSFSQRNVYTNITALDGHSTIFNIVYFNHVDSTTTLDGFTVSNGSTQRMSTGGEHSAVAGAGIFNDGSTSGSSNPIIANDSFVNNFSYNQGGAIYNYGYNGKTNPVITNCTFNNNTTYSAGGGAISNNGEYGVCSPVIKDCIFNGNTTSQAGAAIASTGFNGISNPVITNCVFTNNKASYGAAITNEGYRGTCIPVITNCTFTLNTSNDSSVIYDYAASMTLNNTILWDNATKEIKDAGATTTVNYSDIKSGWTGAGSNNINSNPLFVSSSNVQLTNTSPCVNTGSNAAIPTGVTTDLAGNARIQKGTVDMGAYESSYTPCVNTTSIIDTAICAGSSYTFHTKIFTTAGAHYDTLTNKGGCDSIVTINLTIKQPTTSSTPVSVCSNQLPYSWNNTNYSTGGSYTIHLTNKMGCDSATTLVLTIKQPTTSTTNVSICPSALPYNWNGNNYNIAGRDTVYLTNKAGCDSVTILVLTVKQTSTSTTNVSICPSALPYSWNSHNYTTAGRDTVHLTNKAGCDSVTILVLTVKQTSTSSTPVSVCSSALPYRWNNTNYSTGGNYTIHLTNKVGCDSAATLALTVTSPVTPTVSIIVTPDSVITTGTAVKFTANITNGGTTPHYQWKKNSVNITGATGSTYSVSTLVNADAITCALTSNATCVTTTSATSNKIKMTVNTVPCPTVIANPTPVLTAVCSGGSVPYSATAISANAVYKWQYTTGSITTVDSLWHNFGTNSNTTTLSGITQKTYTRLVVTVPGCATVSSPTALVNIDSVALNATATNVTASSALLSWNSILGATYSITINGHTYASGTNLYTVTGLSACHSYTATITATGGTCGGTPTGSVNLTTPPAAIALTLTAGTGGTLVANWNAGVGPYKLYYGQQTAQQNLTLVNVAAGTTSYTIAASHVASGASYMAYVVDAGSTCTPIAQSKYAYYNVAGGSCTGTSPVIVSPSSTATTFTVNWTGASAAYQVYYKNTSGNWVSYSTSANTFTITGASPNTCYPYYVVNKCGTTFGLSSPVDTVCTPAECAAPLNLVLSQPTCKGFTATWNTAAGAANYQVYCAITTGVGTPTWNVSYASSNAVTFTTFGQGTPVAVYVEGNCTVGGRSIASNIETMTTLSVGCKDDNNNITSSTNTNAFSVYPNPNTGTFKVLMNTLSTNASATLDVMDVLGRTIYTTDVTNNNGVINESIDLNNAVPSGIYMVRVRCGNDTHIAKVEVQK